jgi:hypothetical protein
VVAFHAFPESCFQTIETIEPESGLIYARGFSMDYSAISNDDQSPWNTSPKASTNEPTLPTPPLGNSMYSSATASFPSPALSQGFRDRASDDEHEEAPHFEDSQEIGPQSPQSPQQPQRSPRQSQHAPPRQPSEGQSAPSDGQQATASETATQSGQKPARASPQYKLHCKITALERTGKKDVIIRFDAQVNAPLFRIRIFAN